MSKHLNGSGPCKKCIEIMNKFPNFDPTLKNWFITKQNQLMNCHISDAGRGKLDQEVYFQRGASKAHYGQSSHNFNAALDIFFIEKDGSLSYADNKYALLTLDLPDDIVWYGAPKAKFPEKPHFELKDWKTKCTKLVE